jgi:membrane protein
MAKSNKGTIIDRAKSRFEELQKNHFWVDHLVRTVTRYQDRKADFFAAGVTYFSVLTIVPLLMVGFAALGQVLVLRPDLLEQIKGHITASAQGGPAQQLNHLVDGAIASRGAVGTLGLAIGLWSGLGWIASLREALTQLWLQDPSENDNWFKKKFSDLIALVSFGLALLVVLGFVALSKNTWLVDKLNKLLPDHWSGSHSVIKMVSTVFTVLATWALFTFVISRLPRRPVPLRDAARAGLLGAVVFQLFLELAWLLLRGVSNGPAGKTFGPVLVTMVFVFFTIRIVLFATSWAATEVHGGAAVPPASDPEGDESDLPALRGKAGARRKR